MQLTTVLVAALAAVVSANPAAKRQTTCPQVGNIPACGYPCIQTAVTNLGCGATDYKCMCSNFSALQTAAASCVVSKCGITTGLTVLSAAQAVCKACA